MAQRPELNARDVARLIGKGGWRLVEQKGSHMQFANAAQPGKVTVPNHAGDTLSDMTLKSIFNQAGMPGVLKDLQRGKPIKKIEKDLEASNMPMGLLLGPA